MKSCTKCGAEFEGRWKRCDPCRAAQRRYSKNWREGVSSAGLCRYCSGQLSQGQSICCGADACREAHREFRKGQINERLRKAYAADPDVRARRLERNAMWRAGNRELVRRLLREEYQRNPLRRAAVKDAARRRRALVRAASGNFTVEQLTARLSMYPRCWICKTAEPTHIDHVKPLARGGAHILSNLRPACAECNLRKGSKWPFLPLT